MLENKFFKSALYFSIISLITTIFWFFGLESIGMPIFAGIAIAILIYSKNGIHVVPFLLNMLFMISRTEWSMDTIPIYLYILPALFVLAMIFHMIKNKIKLFDGKLKYPLLMLLAAMLLSTINAESFTIGYIFYYFIGIFYLFIYFFFKGSLKGDNLEYLIKLFSVLGVMIAIQVLLYHLRLDDILYEIRNNDIDLGWGISNFVATYLSMFIISIFYYIKTYKKGYFLIPICLFEVTMLMLTSSRGGILAFGSAFVFLIFFLNYNVKNKYKILIYLSLVVLISLIAVYINLDFFQTMFRRLFSDFFDDNYRFINWKKGWNAFIAHPIFGSGIFSEVNDNYFKLYHSTIIHTLGTLGIFGLIALVWQFVNILQVFLNKLNMKKSILLIAIIAANVQGLVDNVYYMPQFMIIFFIIIAATENQNIIKSLNTIV